MPESSAACERFFSSAGLVAEIGNLGQTRFETQTVLRTWLKQQSQQELKDLMLDITRRIQNRPPAASELK